MLFRWENSVVRLWLDKLYFVETWLVMQKCTVFIADGEVNAEKFVMRLLAVVRVAQSVKPPNIECCGHLIAYDVLLFYSNMSLPFHYITPLGFVKPRPPSFPIFRSLSILSSSMANVYHTYVSGSFAIDKLHWAWYSDFWAPSRLICYSCAREIARSSMGKIASMYCVASLLSNISFVHWPFRTMTVLSILRPRVDYC